MMGDSNMQGPMLVQCCGILAHLGQDVQASCSCKSIGNGRACEDEEELLGGRVCVRGCLVPRLKDLQAKGEGNAVCQRVKDQCQAVGLLRQAICCQLLQSLLLNLSCPAA